MRASAWLLPSALVAATVVLAVGLHAKLTAPLQLPETSRGDEAPIAPAAEGLGLSDASFIAPPRQAYADIDTRPVFSPTRRPVVIPPPAPPPVAIQVAAPSPPPPPSDLLLVGVIIGSERNLAVLKSTYTAETMTVEAGGVIEGWEVVKILADRIVIGFGDAREEMKLYQNNNDAVSGVNVGNIAPAIVLPTPIVNPINPSLASPTGSTE